jgi:hypothetical protein
MRRIWGCDYDTHAVHLAWLPLDPRERTEMPGQLDAIGWKTYVYRQKGETAFHAMEGLVVAMLSVPGFEPDDMFYIEHGFGANRKSDHALGRVQGAIVACVYPRVRSVEEVNLSTWRKMMYGKGTGVSRDEADRLVAPALEKCLGVVPVTPDLRAALAIAYTGRILNEEVAAGAAVSGF